VPGYVSFAREFLRSPLVTASPVPTGAALARIAVAPLPENGDPVVVELGAGTGSTTRAVQHRLAGRGRHIAVEANPRMARLLQRENPTVEVVGDGAHDVVRRLIAKGVRAELVFSTLPPSATAGTRVRADAGSRRACGRGAATATGLTLGGVQSAQMRALR